MNNLQSALALTLTLALVQPVPVRADEKVDLLAIHKLKREAYDNSKVMDTLFHLTDVNGARLTGSPGHQRAAEFAVKRLKEYGIEDSKLEKFEFGNGWSFSRFAMNMVEPVTSPIIGYPMAWTPGTNGPLTAEVIYAPLTTAADMQKWKGKLRDKIVMVERVRDLALPLTPQAKRYTDAELEEILKMQEGGAGNRPPVTAEMLGLPPTTQLPSDGDALQRMVRGMRAQRIKFLKEEGAAAVLTVSTKGEGGTVFGTSYGSQDPKNEVPPTAVAIAGEHYARMVRLLNAKIPVKLEIDIKAEFHQASKDSFNVIGDLAGTGKNKDEVVMIGAHLDSWHGATGATDNGASCAVMIEVMRILKASGVKLNRSVRIGLWGGEEQGLLGSRAYAKEHFADRETMTLKKDHAKFSAYFNIDNGGGKLRGIYAQSNEMVMPIFKEWIAPFKEMGVTHVSIRNTGSTDHVSLDEVGLPAFQFIQDPLDYSPRTHHSNMDTYDRIQKSDLMQQASALASFVYHAANRDEMMPRKPLPKPRPRPSDPAKSRAEATPSGGGQGQ